MSILLTTHSGTYLVFGHESCCGPFTNERFSIDSIFCFSIGATLRTFARRNNDERVEFGSGRSVGARAE